MRGNSYESGDYTFSQLNAVKADVLGSISLPTEVNLLGISSWTSSCRFIFESLEDVQMMSRSLLVGVKNL